MATKRKKMLHMRSSLTNEDGSPKLPQVENLEYGEIAINYAQGVETIAIKNSENEIVRFGKEVVVGIHEPDPKGNSEIFIDERDDSVVEVCTKSQFDAFVENIQSKNTEIESSIETISDAVSNKIICGGEESSIYIDTVLDDSPVEVYSKAEVDALFAQLRIMNPSLN